MQAIILAAGMGRRLTNITNNIIPKSFLEIEGKRVIDYHLDNLLKRGIRDVTLVVGYKKNLFIDTFGSSYMGININYVEVENYKEVNHSRSLFLTKDTCNKINKDVIVIHSDHFYDPEMLDLLIKNEEKNLILVDKNYKINTEDELIVYGDGENNIISSLFYIKEEFSGQPAGEFLGLHKFDINLLNKFYKYLESVSRWDIGYDRLLTGFLNEKNIIKYKSIGNLSWVNINHPSDYSYAKNTVFRKAYKETASLPNIRRRVLKRLLDSKDIVRILEVHSGLTGLIVEKTQSGEKEFDGMWLSSLTHSTSKGKPDIQYIDITTISQTLGEIFDVTTKPMIVDADNGGFVEHFKFMVRSLERLGVSAVIIEDKTGVKKNSLFGTDVSQTQDTIENFCFKISEGKKSQVTEDFMIIARVESLILKQGMEDALLRAFNYVDAGADGIMIHSKKEDPKEILEFCQNFRFNNMTTPIIVVPTTYNVITESELIQAGVNVVIYANHLLRSAYPAMNLVAKSILENERSWETNDACLPIKEILTLIPGAK